LKLNQRTEVVKITLLEIKELEELKKNNMKKSGTKTKCKVKKKKVAGAKPVPVKKY
jgi:hypothetical protein